MTENEEKLLKEIGFTNDLVFKEVMRRKPDICKEIIHRCCPDIDTENMTITTEYEVIADTADKRIRLDILTEAESQRLNLEMYTYDPGYIKTARYHAAMLDAQLPLSKTPNDLPDVTVIFLCTSDPLKRGLPVYTVRSKVEEMPKLTYNEGRRIIFLSPTAINEAPEELRPVLASLTESDEYRDDPFVRSIKEAVREVKNDTGFKKLLMDERLKEYCIRKEEAEKVREEVREEELVLFIRSFRKFGIDDASLLEEIISTHSLTREKAIELMRKAS